MEEVKEVPTMLEALQAISEEMPIIGKNKTADAGKFSYGWANLEKVYEIAKPIVKKHGFITDFKVEGNKVILDAFYTHTKETKTSFIDMTTVDPQKKGGELTYYRRYLFCVVFDILIADEDKDAQGTELVDEKYLENIKEQLSLMNDLEDLTKYFLQIKPTDKKVIALFTARRNEVGV